MRYMNQEKCFSTGLDEANCYLTERGMWWEMQGGLQDQRAAPGWHPVIK
jgi:hypothetical protein